MIQSLPFAWLLASLKFLTSAHADTHVHNPLPYSLPYFLSRFASVLQARILANPVATTALEPAKRRDMLHMQHATVMTASSRPSLPPSLAVV